MNRKEVVIFIPTLTERGNVFYSLFHIWLQVLFSPVTFA